MINISNKNIEFQLYGYLVQLRELYMATDTQNDEIQIINDYIELIKTRRFNVAVMGEFRRGKSSLINALLGTKILPSDVTPTTATINRITYGNEPYVSIYYHDGRVEPISINAISDYVTKLTDEGEKRASQIKEAVIQYPTVICQNYVDIIDTPGLNDDADMTKVTINMLNNVDAVIVAISALSPFSDLEKSFVCQLLNCDNVENLVFVVTYIDKIDEDEQDKLLYYIHNRIKKLVIESLKNDIASDDILAKADRIINNSLIFGVSSYLALKSFISNDRNLLIKSRFEEFKTQLYDSLTSQQGVNLIIKTIKGIKNLCSMFELKYKNNISDKNQQINDISELILIINDYINNYEKIYNSLLNNEGNNIETCLAKIFEFNNIFINNFNTTLSQINNLERNVKLSIISSVEANIVSTINDDLRVYIRNQIIRIFDTLISKFSDIRKDKFINNLVSLKEVHNVEIDFVYYFNPNMTEITNKINIPFFKWKASIIPSNISIYNNNLLMHNFKVSLKQSLQTFYNDCRSYIYSNSNIWLTQIKDEVLKINSTINLMVKDKVNLLVKEIDDKKESLIKYSNIINDIINNVDIIYKSVLTNKDS